MAGESQLCLFRAGTCRWWTCQISEIGNEPRFLRGLPCFERGAGAGGVGLGENSLRRGGFFHPRRSGRQLDGFTSHHLNRSALSRGGGGEVPTQDCHGTGGKDERYTPSPVCPPADRSPFFPPVSPCIHRVSCLARPATPLRLVLSWMLHGPYFTVDAVRNETRTTPMTFECGTLVLTPWGTFAICPLEHLCLPRIEQLGHVAGFFATSGSRADRSFT
jgi:hypothetical protein